MRRILFHCRGRSVYSYPVMLYLGLVLGMVAGNYAANLQGLRSGRVFTALVLLTIPALAGARLLFVATHWHAFRREPRRIWRRAEGGAALMGGLLPTLLVSVPLLTALDVDAGAFWDVAAVTILVAMILARMGCLLNGCCSGRPTAGWLALTLPDHRGVWQRRVPAQLLEAGLAALILAGSAAFWHLRPFAGAIFLASLASYAIGRIALQPTREIQDRIGRFNLQQAICAVFAAAAVAGLFAGWRGPGI